MILGPNPSTPLDPLFDNEWHVELLIWKQRCLLQQRPATQLVLACVERFI